MNQPIDVNEVVDQMLIPVKDISNEIGVAANTNPSFGVTVYLVQRRHAVVVSPTYEVAHRERLMVPLEAYEQQGARLKLTGDSLNSTSDIAENMCAQRNLLQEQCNELAEKNREQAQTILNLERQLFDRDRP